MKQYIQASQVEELSGKGKRKLVEWLKDKNWYIKTELLSGLKDVAPLLSIGQLIEYLGEDWVDHVFEVPFKDGSIFNKFKGELCDALWEAVKVDLEK